MLRSVFLFLLTLALLAVAPIQAGHNPDGDSIGFRSVKVKPIVEASSAPRLVAIEMELYIESEVKVQVSDALGYELFQSTATYPEGRQVIRLSLGNMKQGIYFVRVSTDLEDQMQVVSLLKQ